MFVPMNRKLLLGISLATVFIFSIMMLPINADLDGMLDITGASSDGTNHKMQVADNLKNINKKESDIVTFWAWAIDNPEDAPDGTFLTVDALTIHHLVNDHQAFGKDAKSTPVQGYHPHRAFFDSDFCVIGLQSPKADFRVKDNTLQLASDDIAFLAATGTIGAVDGCPIGLGITELRDMVAIP